MGATERVYQSAPELLEAGVLRTAEQPPRNWRDLKAVPAYTVPLIAEDYPAKTAAMWNAAYEQFGMPDRNAMVVADPAHAAAILAAFRRDPKYRGGGAGVGFKEAVLPHLDGVEPLARAMGAVNIIKKAANGRLLGENTDGTGFAMALEEKFRNRGEPLDGKRVLLLGAGGAGRAIAFALAGRGALLTILNRTPERAREVAVAVNAHYAKAIAVSSGRDAVPFVLRRADAVVSVIDDRHSPLDEYSTVGAMTQPVTPEAIAKNLEEARSLLLRAKHSLIVSDIRIRKRETAMLAQARALGFETLDGLPMVVNQGIEAFWWLYGEELAGKGHAKNEVAAIMKDAAQQAG